MSNLAIDSFLLGRNPAESASLQQRKTTFRNEITISRLSSIQFGWTLPGGPRNNIARATFLATLTQGFEIINHHFDPVWLTDHLKSQGNISNA